MSRDSGPLLPGARPVAMQRACGHWETLHLRDPVTPFLRAVAATVPCPRCRPRDPSPRRPPPRRRRRGER